MDNRLSLAYTNMLMKIWNLCVTKGYILDMFLKYEYSQKESQLTK